MAKRPTPLGTDTEAFFWAYDSCVYFLHGGKTYWFHVVETLPLSTLVDQQEEDEKEVRAQKEREQAHRASEWRRWRREQAAQIAAERREWDTKPAVVRWLLETCCSRRRP